MVKREKLRFSPAVIYQVRTTVDGGLRLTFDVDASQTETVAALLLLRQREAPVTLVVEEYGTGKKTVTKRK